MNISKLSLVYLFTALGFGVGCGKSEKNKKPAKEAGHSSEASSDSIGAPGFRVNDDNRPSKTASKTIVLFNTNYSGAKELAFHYAQARKVNDSQLCGIPMPVGATMTEAQLLGARRQMINDCLCPHLPTVTNCNELKTDEIAANSPFTHLVIIKGVPIGLTNYSIETDPLAIGFKEPIIDRYLAAWVYRQPVPIMDNHGYEHRVKDMTPFPRINPKLHRTMVFGRIDGITIESAKRTIDRTIAAEKEPSSGNWLSSSSAFQENRSKLSANAKECDPQFYPQGIWPHKTCKAGFISDGRFPAGSGSTPTATNISFFDNYEYNRNNHTTANGSFERLMNWRKATGECKPLCMNELSQESCRSSSKDFFKEINTDCVGAAADLMGWQHRSYTVQYFGVYPAKWETVQGFYDPPTPMQGDAFKNERFQDDKFIRFGGSVLGETCKNAEGASVSCNANIRIRTFTTSPIGHDYSIPAKIPKIKARLRYKAQAPIGKLEIKLWGKTNKNRTLNFGRELVSLNDSPSWNEITTSTYILPVDQLDSSSGEKFISTTLQLYAAIPARTIDIDGVEIVGSIVGSEQAILDVAQGSFSLPAIDNLTTGDYAANMIERIGAIGWWGSASHFKSAGAAFADRYQKDYIDLFSQGLTLGEALYLRFANSGLIYADPLYQPFQAKIHISGDEMIYHEQRFWASTELQPVTAYIVDPQVPKTSARNLKISAKLGEEHLTRWKLEKCSDGTSPLKCTNWQMVLSGDAAVENQDVTLPNGLLSLFDGDATNVILRLEVLNATSPKNKLTDYIGFMLRSNIDLQELFFVSYSTQKGLGRINYTPGFRNDQENPTLISVHRQISQFTFQARGQHTRELSPKSASSISGATYQLSVEKSSTSQVIKFVPPIEEDVVTVKFSVDQGAEDMTINFVSLNGGYSLMNNSIGVSLPEAKITRQDLSTFESILSVINFRCGGTESCLRTEGLAVDFNEDGIGNDADLTSLRDYISATETEPSQLADWTLAGESWSMDFLAAVTAILTESRNFPWIADTIEFRYTSPRSGIGMGPMNPNAILQQISAGEDAQLFKDTSIIYKPELHAYVVKIFNQKNALLKLQENGSDTKRILVGDIDNDGRVSTSDLQILAASFNHQIGSASYNVFADLDGNGTVNEADLEIWKDNFNAIAVPSP